MAIPNTPITVSGGGSAAPGNIMFVVDDSNSMDREKVSPKGTWGDSAKGETQIRVAFMTKETMYSPWKNDPYLYQLGGGGCDTPDKSYNSSGQINDEINNPPEHKLKWRHQWHEYNSIYYNPGIEYEPWENSPYNASEDGQADPDNPRQDPTKPATSDMNATYYDFANPYGESPAGPVDIPNAHYYIRENDKPYLVYFKGGQIIYHEVLQESDCRIVPTANVDTFCGTGNQPTSQHYFDGYCTGTTQALCSPNERYEYVATKLGPVETREKDRMGRDYVNARQNFANWFTYYRNRTFIAKGAVVRAMKNLSGVNVGFFTIHPKTDSIIPAQPIDDAANLSTLISAVYGFDVQAGTSLLGSLEMAGRYFDKADSDNTIGPSPYADQADGGSCQQAFTILMTDGAYDDRLTSGSYTESAWANKAYTGNNITSVGDANGDGCPNELADVSKYYYDKDLSPAPDLVPAGGCGATKHQHMVTYTIGFGVSGTVSLDAYPECTNSCPDYPNNCGVCPAGFPCVNGDKTKKIDDLWHTALNAGGRYMSAADPAQLRKALNALVSDIKGKLSVGSAAAVSVSAPVLQPGNTVMYRTTYDPVGWEGDVIAYTLGEGGAILDPPLWKAGEVLNSTPWGDRKIFTHNGEAGIAFDDYADLTDRQKGSLHGDPEKGQLMMNYLKGDRTNEGPTFRERADGEAGGACGSDMPGILGDIIHSSPLSLLEGDYIYVGANDGMLHAFRTVAGTDPIAEPAGSEAFAYIPNLVFDKLKNLISTEYNHDYFVDAMPYAEKIAFSEDLISDEEVYTFLVGGLGKGGKGYYCLDISDLTDFEANDARSRFEAEDVKWEYPPNPPYDTAGYPVSSDPDMGFSFSRPYIVNSNLGKWVVIFGNGYDSENAQAVLYILDAIDGSLLKKIKTDAGSPTEAGQCNGLSTPLLIDYDGNKTVDYVYAGDLLGNLWKFDISEEPPDGSTLVPESWDVAYDGNPLFQARNKAGQSQPITTRPDAMKHCEGKPGYIVVFGTGRYILPEDVRDTTGQTIYGIWDWEDAAWPENGEQMYLGSPTGGDPRKLSNLTSKAGPVSEVTLLNQEIAGSTDEDSETYGEALTDNPITWFDPGANIGEHVGWYFDLPESGERVIDDVIIRSGKAVVLSNIPLASGGEDPCTSGKGASYLNILDACTGGRPSEDQFSDLPVEITTESGEKVNVTGNRRKDDRGMGSGPTIIKDGPRDIYLVNPISPSPPSPLPVPGTAGGMIYWIER